MNDNIVKICKVREVKTPSRAYNTDAGIDFFMPEDLTLLDMEEKFKLTGDFLEVSSIKNNKAWQKIINSFILKPGQSIIIPSGIKIKVPEGYMFYFANKSGIASKKHLLVGAQVIDIGYMGEININLHNVGTCDQVITAGDKICQGIFVKLGFQNFECVEDEHALFGNNISDRGAGGFGSTGLK